MSEEAPNLSGPADKEKSETEKPFTGTSSEFDTSVFQWAWQQLEGWGKTTGKDHKTWDFADRVAYAQLLTKVAILDPLGLRTVRENNDDRD